MIQSPVSRMSMKECGDQSWKAMLSAFSSLNLAEVPKPLNTPSVSSHIQDFEVLFGIGPEVKKRHDHDLLAGSRFQRLRPFRGSGR